MFSVFMLIISTIHNLELVVDRLVRITNLLIGRGYVKQRNYNPNGHILFTLHNTLNKSVRHQRKTCDSDVGVLNSPMVRSQYGNVASIEDG